MNKYQKFHQKILNNIDSNKRISPLKAIRAFCLECVGFQANEVESCSANSSKDTRCPLYRFRLGINETGRNRASQASDESPDESRSNDKGRNE